VPCAMRQHFRSAVVDDTLNFGPVEMPHGAVLRSLGRTLCFYIRLSVCLPDYFNSYEGMLMKSSAGIESGQSNSHLDY